MLILRRIREDSGPNLYIFSTLTCGVVAPLYELVMVDSSCHLSVEWVHLGFIFIWKFNWKTWGTALSSCHLTPTCCPSPFINIHHPLITIHHPFMTQKPQRTAWDIVLHVGLRSSAAERAQGILGDKLRSMFSGIGRAKLPYTINVTSKNVKWSLIIYAVWLLWNRGKKPRTSVFLTELNN